jgi:CBS domain-containing protein
MRSLADKEKLQTKKTKSRMGDDPMKKRVSKVSDIITKRSVLTVTSDESIAALSRRLQKERVGAMIVSDDGVSIAGIISERDIAYALSLHRGDLHEMKVRELMTKKVITCSPDDRVYDVVRLMADHHIRHVPVVLDGKVIGVIGMRDVIEQRLDDLEENLHLMKKLVVAR